MNPPNYYRMSWQDVRDLNYLMKKDIEFKRTRDGILATLKHLSSKNPRGQRILIWPPVEFDRDLDLIYLAQPTAETLEQHCDLIVMHEARFQKYLEEIRGSRTVIPEFSIPALTQQRNVATPQDMGLVFA